MAAFVLMIPAGASAQEPAIAPGYEEFEGCVTVPAGESLGQDICLRFSATGDLKLGDVEADLSDPIELVVGATAGDEGTNIYTRENGGDPEPVKLEGGLLGIPALDPLLDPIDVLGVWGVHALPQLGDPDADVGDMVEFALSLPFLFAILPPGTIEPNEPFDLAELTDFLGGLELPDQNLGLPLSIDVKNLLLGTRCSIGTEESPIDIQMTTGETSPPEGVDPLTGDWGLMEASIFGPTESDFIGRVHGAKFVDNGFAVPGASNCNTLTSVGFEGTPIESLVNMDSLIGSQAGLPSPEGNNVADLDVDLSAAFQRDVLPSVLRSPSAVDFGEVAVGDVATEVIEVTTNRESLSFGNSFLGSGSAEGGFQLASNTCEGQQFELGETCEVEVTFEPPSPGAKSGSYQQPVSAGAGFSVPFAGTGVEP